MRRARVALSVLSTVAVAASSAGAQHLPTGPAVQRALRDTALAHDIPGQWLAKPPAVHAAITGAQRTAMLAQIGSVANLLRASLGALPGVEADAAPGVEPTQLPNGGSVVGGYLKLLLWPYSVRDGRLTFYDNAAEIMLRVNRSACRGPNAIGSGYGFVLAPRVNGRFHGFPMLDSVVVITHRAAPPCIPVTRGEIVQAIAQRMSAGSAGSARMSPAERASPAYLSDHGCHAATLETCFVDASAPGAHAVVRENPTFFDTARPTDIQIVTFDLRPIEGARRNAQYSTAVLESALARLDWAALNAIVH